LNRIRYLHDPYLTDIDTNRDAQMSVSGWFRAFF
jgi:hypothetical protein